MNRYLIMVSVALCLFAVIVAGCGNIYGAGGKKTVKEPVNNDILNKTPSNDALLTPVSGQELMSSAESEKEAKDIAAKYGIEFVEYSWGVATYHTTEDPSAVIARGKKKGLPELSLNTMAEAYGNGGNVGDGAVQGGFVPDKKTH